MAPPAIFPALAGISPVNLTSKRMQRTGQLVPANKTQVWTPAAISRTTAPPLGALLFGNFLVFDSCTGGGAQEREALFPGAKAAAHAVAPEGVVCVEVVGGPSRMFGLLPSHRFEVARERGGGNGGGEGREGVRVTLSHVRCDPYTGGRVRWWMKVVHLVYARLLFADGAREVLRR